MGKPSKLLKNSFIYTVVSVLQKAINFFLLPIYTLYLTVEDYGLLSVILSIAALLNTLFLFSLPAAATRFHYDSDSHDERKEIWGTILALITIITFSLSLTLIVFRNNIFPIVAKDINFYPFILIGLIYTMLNTFYTLYQSYLQASQNAAEYGKNLLMNFLLNVLLILFFLLVLKLKVLGIFCAYLITAIVFFIYTFFRFAPNIKLNLNKERVKNVFKYSIPLVPHALAGWIISLVDRVFVNNYYGPGQAGLYSIGVQFSVVLTTLTLAFYQAYSPWFFEKITHPLENIRLIKKVGTTSFVLFCFVALIFSLFSENILYFMVSRQFHLAYKVIPILCFGYVLGGFYFINVAPLFINKTKMIPIITILSSLLGLGSNFIFVPMFGMMGAAISVFVSYFLSSHLAWIITHRNEKFYSLPYFKSIFIFLCFLLLSFVVYLKDYISNSIFFLLKIGITLTVTFIIYLKYKEDIITLINNLKKK